MIGQRIESRLGFPWGAVVFLLVTLGLAVLAAAVNSIHPLIGAVMPLCISLALLWSRPPAFEAEFTADSLEVSRPEAVSVPYDSLQGLWGKGRSSDPDQPGPRSFPITVVHDEGTFEIPARLSVPSEKVYRFLYDHFPPEGRRGVSPALADYLQEQLQAFGPERVWAYRARSHLGFTSRYRRGRAVSLAIVLAGIVWAVWGFSLGTEPGKGWAGGGIFMAFFGLLFFLAFVAESRRRGARVKNWRQASLVISPVGMALVQGDVKGEMRWDELRDVRFRPRYKSFQIAATREDVMPGITLVFEGAKVIIADLYDQPLRVIHERIRNYWK